MEPFFVWPPVQCSRTVWDPGVQESSANDSDSSVVHGRTNARHVGRVVAEVVDVHQAEKAGPPW